MDLGLAGKVVIVSGAAGGIGGATVRAFANERALPILVDIDRQGIARLAEEIQQAGAKAVPLPADVTSEGEVERVVKETIEQQGRIDILVNNAGIEIVMSMTEVRVEDWDRVINTNLRGTFLFTRAVLPHMIRQNGGNIINIASIDGLKGRAGLAAYCASKGGMIRFTESLADELAKHKIRANVICPAGVYTKMWRKTHPDADPRSVIQPEEIADTILFLASERSRSLNGAVIEMLGPRLEWGTYL